MNKLLIVSSRGRLSARILRSALVLFVGLALAAAFWMATTPVAKAREMSPLEMVKSELPPGKTMTTANKPQVLSAVCSAIKKHRKDAAQIIRAAAEARKDLAKDIERGAFQCMGTDDCLFVRMVVRELTNANPDDASEIREIAIRLAPNCMGGGGGEDHDRGRGDEGEGNFGNEGPGNQNPPPGSLGGGGGGFDPQEGKCIVCHNGHEIRIPCKQVPKYLNNHPGDKAGPCRPTPVTNQ